MKVRKGARAPGRVLGVVLRTGSDSGRCVFWNKLLLKTAQAYPEKGCDFSTSKIVLYTPLPSFLPGSFPSFLLLPFSGSPEVVESLNQLFFFLLGGVLRLLINTDCYGSLTPPDT